MSEAIGPVPWSFSVSKETPPKIWWNIFVSACFSTGAPLWRISYPAMKERLWLLEGSMYAVTPSNMLAEVAKGFSPAS